MSHDSTLWAQLKRQQWSAGTARASTDHVALEAPLEMRVAGVPMAVLMRTPGDDRELVLGFLLTEGIIAHPKQVASIHPCTVGRDGQGENVMVITPSATHPIELERLRRNHFVSSSCGVCGKASIEQVMLNVGAPLEGAAISWAVLRRLPAQLRAKQEGFAVTGGLHAAALFSLDGQLLVVREDVGRHNAVDKVVGAMSDASINPATTVLMVSGRVSFEIVQKAAMAKIPVLAAVSAPTSLAIELAQSANVTLIGFLRGDTCNVYAGVGVVD